MSALIVNNEIVHYEAIGRGRPIVFLHGWAGTWRYWVPFMQEVSTSFRAYAIDMWGFGDTSKAQARYGIDDQIELLRYFLNELGIGKIALVGHDMGGAVAARFAGMFPDLVDRVLAVGYPMGSSQINDRIGQQSTGSLGEWMLNGLENTEAVLREAGKADMEAISRSLENLRSMDLAGLLIRLDMPCLLVHGDKDRAVAAPPLDSLANMKESAHYIIFENTGHFPMLDEQNKFSRLLKDFLALESGESPRHLQLKEEWRRRFR